MFRKAKKEILQIFRPAMSYLYECFKRLTVCMYGYLSNAKAVRNSRLIMLC